MFTLGLAMGTAGMIRPPFGPPGVFCAPPCCCAGWVCGGARAAATSGFDSTGGGGACLATAEGAGAFPACFASAFGSADLAEPSASATLGCAGDCSSLLVPAGAAPRGPVGGWLWFWKPGGPMGILGGKGPGGPLKPCPGGNQPGGGGPYGGIPKPPGPPGNGPGPPGKPP